MNLPLTNPTVNVDRISRLPALAYFLSVNQERLIYLSNNTELFYKPGPSQDKKGSSEKRPTHDAKNELKQVHGKILSQFLQKVNWPEYITGGVRDKSLPRTPKLNADIHAGSKIIIQEDIKSFYPSISPEIVRNIWQYFFCFGPEVSEVLTNLCTYRGEVPQGWKPSGYLAALAFYNTESRLVEELNRRGFKYTRYADDITVSTNKAISRKELFEVISNIYRLANKSGFKIKRTKQKIVSRSNRQEITGYDVSSGRSTINKKIRRTIKNDIYKLEKQHSETNGKAAGLALFAHTWMSLKSKSARLKGIHNKDHQEFICRLNAIKPHSHLLQLKRRDRQKMIERQGSESAIQDNNE